MAMIVTAWTGSWRKSSVLMGEMAKMRMPSLLLEKKNQYIKFYQKSKGDTAIIKIHKLHT